MRLIICIIAALHLLGGSLLFAEGKAATTRALDTTQSVEQRLEAMHKMDRFALTAEQKEVFAKMVIDSTLDNRLRVAAIRYAASGAEVQRTAIALFRRLEQTGEDQLAAETISGLGTQYFWNRGNWGAPEAQLLPEVLALVNDQACNADSVEVQVAALGFAGSLHGKVVQEVAKARLPDPKTDVRIISVLLSQLRFNSFQVQSDEFVPLMLPLLQHANPAIRASAVETIGRLASSRPLPMNKAQTASDAAVRLALNPDEVTEVRIAAVTATPKIRSDATQKLLPLLREPEVPREVRAQVVAVLSGGGTESWLQSLGSSGRKRLVGLLKDYARSHPEHQPAVNRAIHAIMRPPRDVARSSTAPGREPE